MKDKIMERMKSNYENRFQYQLIRKIPVIIRLDGKAFHTYTRSLKKPFDEGLIEDMVETTKSLIKNIQGCKLGYVQSDEISLLLTDTSSIETEAWFDYKLSKIVSVSASICTAMFNKLRYLREIEKLAYFDSRAFNIPLEEVPNYFIARNRDCIKNSVSALAQSLYSSKQLHKMNQTHMKKMCLDKGINWEDLSNDKKYGTLITSDGALFYDKFNYTQLESIIN